VSWSKHGDDRAAAFTQRFDFQPFPDHARRRLLPLPTIARLFNDPR
jgi:hypothetical protein